MLRRRDRQTTGQLFREVADPQRQRRGLDRRAFEELVGALARAGLVCVEEDSFVKEGERIRFERASLTPAGADADADLLPQLRLTSASPAAAAPTRAGRRRPEPRRPASRRASRARRSRPARTAPRPRRR